MGLTDEERAQMQEVGEALTDDQLSEVLKELAIREHALLDGPLGEGEMREVTVHNATVLAAAAARLKALADSCGPASGA